MKRKLVDLIYLDRKHLESDLTNKHWAQIDTWLELESTESFDSVGSWPTSKLTLVMSKAASPGWAMILSAFPSNRSDVATSVILSDAG